MQRPNSIARMLLAVFFAGQFGWTGLALAEEQPVTSPTPQASVSPSPSVTPEPAASPSPTATPEPTVSPSPTATPEPAASPSPTPKPAGHDGTKDESGKDDTSWSKPGVNGCVGVVPRWVYDMSSSTWVPADKGSFTCDPKTGYYLSPKYAFDKTTSWYVILPPSASASDNFLTAPNVVHTVLGDLVVGSKDYQVAEALGLLDPQAGLLAARTSGGQGAAAVPVASGGASRAWFDFTNLVNVINTLQSTATSGNVNATQNTQVGDASSGAVSVLANLINLLASAWSWSSGSLNFFMQNLFGDQTGDVRLNFSENAQGGGGSLGTNAIDATASGSGSSNDIGLGSSSSLGVNASNGAQIVNNVDLLAQSGDVSAHKNTQVGNLNSGSALAEVNIINMINSLINSGSSFFGILNIFGNLNGDILFPEGFLNGVLGSGSSGGANDVSADASGAGAANQVGIAGGGSATVNNSSLNSVANNISTDATSGAAGAGSNTSVGNVATGNATTSQGVFNLANSSIFGDNAVLVIVNVLGHWVGKIMTLPGTGATQSALLTGNAHVTAQASGADSANQIGVGGGQNTTLNNTNVGTITNNVNVKAASGDVTASHNTQVGNVQTGDAKAASNVANIFNTVMNVKHWFGVLVINVLGSMTGDVGNDTAAGTVNPTVAQVAAAARTASATTVPQVGLLSLVNAGSVASAQTVTAVTAAPGEAVGPSELAAVSHQQTPAQVAAAAQNRDMTAMFVISAIMMLLAAGLAVMERRAKRNA